LSVNRPDLALRLVRSSPVIAFDVETTGLDPYACHAVGYVVAASSCSVYVPVRHLGGNAVDDALDFERELARAFAVRSQRGFRTVMHNAGFDLWMAGKQKVIIGAPCEDTMINAVLIDDSDFTYNLADVAQRAGVPPKLGQALHERLAQFGRKGEKDVMKYFHRLRGDDPLAVEYAEGDGVTTYALWQAQQEAIIDRGLARVHRLECSLIPHLAALRRRGIRVDARYAESATLRLREELAKQRLHFPKGFAPNKKTDVVAHLRENGVTAFPLTKTGKLGTAAAFLETTDAGERIIRLRKLEKIEGAFIEPLIRDHMDENGRIHPELVQSKNDAGRGTHTGRFSCVNPNLQQYPKRDEELGKIVRPLIIPDEGYTMAESDVSQQEPRLYAHYSQEESLISGYNSNPPVDVHTITSKLLEIPRDQAKTLGLSLFNGMQPVSLATRLRRPVSEAENLYYRFFAAYPAIRDFTYLAPEGAGRHGYIRTVLGRICHLRYDESRMAVSRIIQGGAADQMKMMLLRACEYAEAHPHIQLLMSIHDSILWQKRKGTKVGEFLKVLEDNSEFYQIVGGQKVTMRVPFPLGTKFGRNWSQCSYGK
jgi:DNA polymerase I